ncbi:MAG: P1 family peptidase, partial [Rhodothalassiaceae bacterium]
TNMGGILVVDGVRVGEALGRYYLKDQAAARDHSGDGSIMTVLATDAPLSDRNLRRLAKRAIAGLARTGASMTNGSGDYVIAFSTSDKVRRVASDGPRQILDLPNDAMSPLFQAAAEATEEAILNSLFRARDVRGHRGLVEALPVDKVMRLWHQARREGRG